MLIVPIQNETTSPHFSPGSRELAKDLCSQAQFWSEKHSHSYGLSEAQACGHEDEPEPRQDKGGNGASTFHPVVMLNIFIGINLF